MKSNNLRLALALAAAFMPRVAWAQHDAHQSASTQASSAELTQCLRVQPVIDNIITGAARRAEAARLSNSPTEMRAAVESLEAALRDIRAQSAPCSTAAAAMDPHAGHTMPAQPQAGTPAQAPAGTPDPRTKAEGAKPADPHAGHSSVKSGDTQVDPVNGVTVDPATARKTTYQGYTYYFSSERSRKEFLQNPAKFAKKRKG